MKIICLRTLALSCALMVPLALAAGCSHEVSHSESDKTGWFGGTTHEANTVYKNSDGSTSVENETTTSKNGTTTVVRDRKTTKVDGSVTVQHETHTKVAGSDTWVTDTKSSN